MNLCCVVATFLVNCYNSYRKLIQLKMINLKEDESMQSECMTHELKYLITSLKTEKKRILLLCIEIDNYNSRIADYHSAEIIL